MSYLLDTCVISEVVARRPTPSVLGWIAGMDETRLFLSVITIGEIKRSVARLPDSERRRALEQWLEGDLMARFRGRILSLDGAVMLTWGRFVAELEHAGRTLPAMDSLIAATVRHYGLRLVTRNEKDFAGSGMEIVNPWRQAA